MTRAIYPVWEAKHRTHGGDRSKGGDTPVDERERTGRPKAGEKVTSVTGDISRDDESARGIRRRLQICTTEGGGN